MCRIPKKYFSQLSSEIAVKSHPNSMALLLAFSLGYLFSSDLLHLKLRSRDVVLIL